MKNTNIYKNMNEEGITLIALVITIIVLLILAGVTINLIIGERGIITRAKETKVIQTKAEILQELELAKGPVMLQGNGVTKLDDYIEYLNSKGLNSHKVTETYKKNALNYSITVEEEYVYNAAQIGDNVIINEEGYIKELKPEISYKIIEKNTNSVKIQIETRRAEECEFLIAKNDGEYKSKHTEKLGKLETNAIKLIDYTYEGLETLAEGEKYNLKIIARNKTGVAESLIDVTIDKIEDADGNIKFNIDPNPQVWTNGNVTTTLETSFTQYVLQYQVNPTSDTLNNNEKWTTYTQPITSEQNETIYVRFWDGVNAGSSASTQITKIDKIPPTGNIQLSSTTNSVKVTVNARDVEDATGANGKSEIKIYHYSKDNGSTYTKTNDNTYTFKNLNQTSNYAIKVKIEDNAGNETVIDGNGKTGTVPTPTITVANPNTWTSGNKNVTITTLSGYTTKYTTDGTIPSASNGITYSGQFAIDRNCTIKAVYLDSTNQIGSSATNTITKIDKTPPSVPTVTYNRGSNSCSWKNNYNLSIASTDSQSGVSYYEVDWTGDGNANGTVASNFIPGNGYSSCNNRFRAVDNVGNRSAWTGSHHIHMDTQAPSTPSIDSIKILNPKMDQGGWSYTISASNSSSDNVGIAKYQYYINNTWTDSDSTSGSGWFLYRVKVRAVDYAGNVSGDSGEIYLNSRRLYIRQLYYALRDGPRIEEWEVNYWDIDAGLSKGADLARIFTSSEANSTYLIYGGYGFADRMYRGILGREADSGGRQYLVDNMNGSFSQFCENVLKLLVNSTEAQNIYRNHGVGAGTI